MTDGQAPHNELWEKIHQSMDWGLEPDPLLEDFVKTHYPDARDMRVLDIGCGRGANTLLLAKTGFQVVAADVSFTALKKMREIYIEDLDIIPTLADITTTLFPPNWFDLIVDVVSLSQLPETDIAAVIGKARDWLKPGGRLFSKLATAPFDSNLTRAPLYLVDETFIGKSFNGFSYDYQPITNFVTSEQLEANYWLVHAKKEPQ